MKASKTRFKAVKICWLFISLTTFTFAFPFISSSQNNYNYDLRKWRLSAGILLNFCSVSDKKISTLTYRGSSPGINVTLYYEGKKAEHGITALYIINSNLSTNTYPKALLSSAIFNMEYVNIYRLYTSPDNSFTCKAGAGVQFLNSKRKFDQLINNNFSFETALSSGPVAELQYNIGERDNAIILTNKTTLPVFFIFSQPSYSGNTFEDQEAENGTAIKKLFISTKTGSFSEFFRIKNQFEVNKYWGNNHALSLFYNWEYYKIKTARNVITANSQAGIQYTYKF